MTAKRRKMFGWLLAILATVVIVGFMGEHFVLRSDAFRDYARHKIEAEAARDTGGIWYIGGFQLNLSPLTATLQEITWHGTESMNGPPLLHIDDVTVGLELGALLHRRINLSEVLVGHPTVHLEVDGHSANNVPSAPPSNGSHTSIFDLAIGHFSLTNGEIDYQDRKTPLDANLLDVEMATSFHSADRRYSGTISYCTGNIRYGTYAPMPHGLRAEFSFTPSQFSLRSADLYLGSSKLSLRAEATGFVNPTVVGDYDLHIHTSDFTAMSPDVKPAGDVHLSGKINYENLRNQPVMNCLSVNGVVESGGLSAVSKEGRVEIRTLKGSYLLSDGDLTVKRMEMDVFGGRIVAGAEIRDLVNTPHYHVKAGLAGISLTAVQRSAHQLRSKDVALAGALSGRIDGFWAGSVQSLRARSDLKVRGDVRSAAHGTKNGNNVPVDADLHLMFDGRAQTLLVENSNVRIPSMTLTADGRLRRSSSQNSRLQIHAKADDLHELTRLAASYGALVRPAVSGSATLDGTVQGPMQKPRASGLVEVRNLTVEGSEWRTASFRFSAMPSQISVSDGQLVNAKQGRATFSAAVSLRDWTLPANSRIQGRLSADKLDLAELQQLGGLHYPISGDISARLAIDGTRLNPYGSGSVAIANGRAYGEIVQTFGAKFKAANGSLNSTLDVSSAAGKLGGTVSYVPKTKAYALQVDAHSITLQKLKALQGNLRIAGNLDVSAKGQGTLDDPQLNATAHLSSFQVGQKSIGELTAQASLANHRVVLNTDSQTSALPFHAQARMELTGEEQLEATIDTAKMPLGPLLATFAGGIPEDFAGQTELHASLKGTLKDTSRIEAHINVPVLDISYQKLQLTAAQPIVADYARSVLTLQPAEIRGTDTSLRLQGSIPFSGPTKPSLTAHGSIDMQLLRIFDPDVTSSGTVALDLHAAGSPGSPTVEGQVKLQDVAMTTSTAPVGLEKLNGVLSLTQDRIQIASMTGEVGGGTVSLGGAVTYRPAMHFALAMQGKSIRLRYPEGLRSLLDTSLSFSGDTKSSTLNGSVFIDSLSFTPEFDLATFGDQFSNSVSTPAQAGFADTIQLGVLVQSEESLRTTSSQVSVEGNVNLRVTGTAANPVVTGRTNLTSGELFYRNNRYQLERGVITFANPNETDPDLNVSVSTTVEQYKLTINLRGTLDKLTTSYMSDPPLASADIIHLVAFGNTTSESAANTASESTDAMVANGALGAAASGGIQKLAGISSLQIDPLIGGSNQDPGARIALQQRVTKNLLFTFSTDVSQPGQEVVQGDYQINKRWSVAVTRDQLGGVSVAGRLHTSH